MFTALAVSGALCACVDDPREPIELVEGPDAGVVEDEVVDDELPQDHDAIFGVLDVNAVWDEDDITVCWEGKAALEAEYATGMGQVRVAARRWEAVTRLKFIGWDDCAATVNPDIRIANIIEGDSASFLGINSRGKAPSMWINLGCWVPEDGCIQDPEPLELCNGIMTTNGEPPPLAECVRTLAVHEFGHAIGLRHEQAHSGNTCSLGPEPQDIIGPGLWSDGEDLWAFDPASVMSYCTWSDDLAQGDVKSATSMYPSQVIVYPDASGGDLLNRVVVGPGTTYVTALPGLQTGEAIVVSAGLTARVCSTASCNTYLPGKHTLSGAVANAVDSVTVTPKPSVHTNRGFLGTTHELVPGTYRSNNGTLPAAANDNIESVYVGHNFDVRMCTSVSKIGTGSGTCVLHGGGPEWDQTVYAKLATSMQNTASYVEVIPKVAVYNEAKFRGSGATFRAGTYYAGAPFTSARSLTIPPSLYVYACDAASTQGGPAGTCRHYYDSVDLPADHAGRLMYLHINYR